MDSHNQAATESHCTAKTAKASTQQSCNPQACTDVPIKTLSPNSFSSIRSGASVHVRWNGGLEYGNVSLGLKGPHNQWLRGVAALRNTGLPPVVSNNGSFLRVPFRSQCSG